MRRAVRTENMTGQRRLAAPAGDPSAVIDEVRPISIGGAIGMAAAIVTTLLLMSVPAEGAEAPREPAQVAAKLVPAKTTSLEQFVSSVPDGAPDAPPDRCWYGPCRDAMMGPRGAHLLRPATGTELYTKRMQHIAASPKRLRRVGDKHLGVRLLESVYAVVGIPAPAFAPTMRAPSAPQRIDVGLRFVKKF